MDGKSVIITGAAKGIGRASAEVLDREGARLVLNDIDEPGLQQTAASLGDGVEVVTVLGDVSAEEDARRIVATASDCGIRHLAQLYQGSRANRPLDKRAPLQNS